MPDALDDDLIARTLRDLLPDQLLALGRADVPGLGTFATHEQASRVAQTPEGPVMMPPEVQVVFTPDAA
jgi:hypothetical protein